MKMTSIKTDNPITQLAWEVLPKRCTMLVDGIGEICNFHSEETVSRGLTTVKLFSIMGFI